MTCASGERSQSSGSGGADLVGSSSGSRRANRWAQLDIEWYNNESS